jgi:hypothetical protein
VNCGACANAAVLKNRAVVRWSAPLKFVAWVTVTVMPDCAWGMPGPASRVATANLLQASIVAVRGLGSWRRACVIDQLGQGVWRHRRQAVREAALQVRFQRVPGGVAHVVSIERDLGEVRIAASNCWRANVVIREEHLKLRSVERLLETLTQSALRRELEGLCGYDTRETGNRLQ